LNPKYFKVVHSQTHDNYDYKVVQPLGNPMVLFSVGSEEDNSSITPIVPVTPLASLHLRCKDTEYSKDTGNKARALITKRPENSGFECDFQGLINKDGQEFELVITNLSSDGTINFNIMKENTKVNMVDPGGLNQVNELRPLESYAVKCDQKDNKTLILHSIYKNDKKGRMVKLTVGEDESSNKVEKQGTYYYLSVVPQINKPDLVAKFKNTKWACVDLFCMKTEVKKYYDRSGDTVFEEEPGEDIGFGLFGEDVYYDDSEYVEESGEDIGFGLFGECIPQSKPTVDHLSEAKGDIIKDSYASAVSGGKEIDVYSSFSGIEYSYDTASEPCVIGLSISEKIEFKDEELDDTMLELAKDLLTDVIKNASKDLLEKITKIYKSEACSICLEDDEDERLDAVFYQCGHQCCHYKCSEKLNKCPLCRCVIKGLLQV
jgi:hypothetical protein